MKKQFRKAMLSTMAMLLVGVMSLTGVTYAWFSQGTEAKVNNFDVTVDLADGAILVATPDAEGNLVFGQTVTPVFADEYEGFAITPTSASIDTTKNTLNFFGAAVTKEDPNKITSEKLTTGFNAEAEKAYWYDFDLYVYNSGSKNLDVYLTYESAVKGFAVNDTDKEKDITATSAALATRVAFTTYAAKAYVPGQGEATYGTWETPDTKIYEPNAKTHTAAGIVDYTASGWGSAASTDKYGYHPLVGESDTAFSRFDKQGANIQTEAQTTYEFGVQGIGNADAKIATVEPGKLVRVTVSIWLEGQDSDCLNDVANTLFEVAIALTTDQNKIAAPTQG